jgi:hypothetical protein
MVHLLHSIVLRLNCDRPSSRVDGRIFSSLLHPPQLTHGQSAKKYSPGVPIEQGSHPSIFLFHCHSLLMEKIRFLHGLQISNDEIFEKSRGRATRSTVVVPNAEIVQPRAVALFLFSL